MREVTGLKNSAWAQARLLGAFLTIVIFTASPPFASPLSAADWARDMFEVQQHDFGTIAAHAKAEFAFRFTNKYLHDVRVASVRSSCGCSDVRVTKNSLAAYESSEVVASIRSERLRSNQSSTLTVVFDKPRYAEVQLRVTVFIRGDIVIEPSGFDFGEVNQGTLLERKVKITRYGAPDWRLTDILADTSHLECELSEPLRSSDRVSYWMTTRLAPELPPGDLRVQLLLVTNDARAMKIPVMVEGTVSPSVSVAPRSLFMGALRPGQTVSKQIVVRGSQPFRIEEFRAECDCFQFPEPAAEPKTFHLIPVKFTAGNQPGRVRRTIQVKTDFGGSQAELLVLAAIDELAQ